MSEELTEESSPASEEQQESEPAEEKPEEEPVVEPNDDRLAQLEKEKADALRQLTARAKKAEAEKRVLEAKLKATASQKQILDVEDYIDISAALDGLDQREKERLAREHKLTGRPLSEIRKDEDFLLWQDAYRKKVEKEKSLSPSNKQPEIDRPLSFTDKLRKAATMAEKEKLLIEKGLYKEVKIRPDRANIGGTR